MTDSTLTPWTEFQALIATPTLPDLGPQPRPDRLPVAELDARLTQFFRDRAIAESLQPWLRSAAFLWHDHLEASHQLSQQIAGPDGSFLHGLMHRREPDSGNAKHWFHRVGRHEAFRPIARQATHHLVQEKQTALVARLVPNGLWDPFAFIDACEATAGAVEADPRRAVLRRVQALEFAALVEAVLGKGVSSSQPPRVATPGPGA
jgi:hypothetical protein